MYCKGKTILPYLLYEQRREIMTPTQKSYLDNLTVVRAQKVIDKFGGDPAIAEAKSAEA